MISLRSISASSFIALMLVLSGCSGVNSLVGGSDVVTSLNYSVDLANYGLDAVDEYLYYDLADYDQSVIDMQEGTESAPYFTCSFQIPEKDFYYGEALNPSTDFTETERNTLIGKATTYTDTLNAIEENCKALSRYVVAENYKDDDFAQGNELSTTLWEEVESFYDLHNDYVDYIEVLFDAYEDEYYDASDPDSVALKTMDSFLDLADEALDIAETVSDSETPEAEDFSLFSELYSSMIAAHLEATTSNSDMDAMLQASYDDFFNSADTVFIPGLEKIMRDHANQDWVGFADGVGYSIWDYNSLVDLYNAAIDTMEAL